jgi:hypothetical protein
LQRAQVNLGAGKKRIIPTNADISRVQSSNSTNNTTAATAATIATAATATDDGTLIHMSPSLSVTVPIAKLLLTKQQRVDMMVAHLMDACEAFL